MSGKHRRKFVLETVTSCCIFTLRYLMVTITIVMFDYRLSFDIKVIKNSDENSNKIEVLIISRKDVSAWKKGNDSGNKDRRLHYSKSGERINDIFKPSVSDAYAFILSNKTSPFNNNLKTKTVEATLIHTWQQEIKESRLKDM